MVESNFKWKNDWSKASELASKIYGVVVAHDQYHALLKFDKDYDEITRYTIVSHNSEEYDKQFAQTINTLIEEYVRDEES